MVDVLKDVRVEALLASDRAGALDKAYVTGLGPSKDPQTYICVRKEYVSMSDPMYTHDSTALAYQRC